jgi:hypothetical protein
MERDDPSLVTQGWISDKPYPMTLDTGVYMTVARPDILKKPFLTPTLGQHPLKIWVFVTNTTNYFILGLDFLHAHDVSVDLGRQMLHLAEEEVSVWSPSLPDW